MVKWIGLYAKLHNFIIDHNDLWSEGDEAIVLDKEDVVGMDDAFPMQGPEGSGSMLLTRVMAYALGFHKCPGGCLFWDN